MRRKNILVVIALAACSVGNAAELSDASNYRQYNELLSSSGQPSGEQLQQAAEEGFERIVYLAFTDNDTAIEHEDRIVKSLGMDYVHIPIDFQNPTLEDFRTFVGAMEPERPVKTLVHCQVNFRASTVSFLYRVIYLDAPVAKAKTDLDNVWSLNETWFRFLRSTLKRYGKTHTCEACDWGEYDFVDEDVG
jgi:protein tyrosine phosphatase (PTP) superfamily phosphohydrolase (DUF442 family)